MLKYWGIWGFLMGLAVALPHAVHGADPTQLRANPLNTLQQPPGLDPLSREASASLSSAKRPGKTLVAGQSYPVPPLERVEIRVNDDGRIWLPEMPRFSTKFTDKFAGISPRSEFVFYSLEPELQNFATDLVKRASAPHVAIVAMEPSTGRVLAAAGKSTTLANPILYAGYPAASLFKIVTAAAAVEQAGLAPETLVSFRGGNYTLNQWNYAPGRGKDNRFMSLADALGKSVNPVFSRVALKYLNQDVLKSYAFAFGFNNSLSTDISIQSSRALIPYGDFELGRTAAGFGDVTISPIHAAALMSGIAHKGLLPRPSLIERVVSPNGAVVYEAQPEMLTRIMSPATASILLDMMEKTTTIGTSRTAFNGNRGRLMPNISVAAKTGTLRGSKPEGINNWFVAAAPVENPKIAVAVIVVHEGGYNVKASQLGRMVIQKFFNEPVTAAYKAPVYKKTYKKVKAKQYKPSKGTYSKATPKKKVVKAKAKPTPKPKKSNVKK
jgi:peptidoglycan glycosyltransferase